MENKSVLDIELVNIDTFFKRILENNILLDSTGRNPETQTCNPINKYFYLFMVKRCWNEKSIQSDVVTL